MGNLSLGTWLCLDEKISDSEDTENVIMRQNPNFQSEIQSVKYLEDVCEENSIPEIFMKHVFKNQISDQKFGI